MATAYLVPALLRLQKSSQSGSKTMTGTYVAVYEDDDSNPWLFIGASIDLSNMVAGDAVAIRISSKRETDGSYAVEDTKSYTGVQPTNSKTISIGTIANVYGIKIEMYQSAGTTYKALYCEFMTAKR